MLIALWIAAILLLSFLLLNALYKRTNFYKSGIAEVQKFVSGVPMQLEIVNTGSSYASYGISYDNCALNGFNFGIQPQPLEYDFRLLKNYAKNMNSECIVLITLACPFEFFCDSYLDISNTKYYYFLPPNLIDGYSKWKYFSRVKYPALSAGYNLRRLIKDIKQTPFHDRTSVQTQSEVLHEAKNRSESWRIQFGLASFNENSINDWNIADMKKNCERLKDMLSFCVQHQFRPVIVIMPVTDTLSSLFSSEFSKIALYDNMYRCCNKNNVPILDYYLDTRLQDKELYINSDFLNARGRKKFSEILFNDLEKLGYIKENVIIKGDSNENS